MASKKRSSPGTLIYTGSVHKATKITHIKYHESTFKQFDSLKEFETNCVDWVIVEGLSDVQFLEQLQKKANIDPLIMEDILHVNQRTKMELFGDAVFAVYHYTYIKDHKEERDYISVLLTKDAVFTFSEHTNLFLDDAIKRIQIDGSRIRNMKHDYLFYVLFDMVVDESMEAVQEFMRSLQQLELSLHLDTKENQLTLYNIRKNLLTTRNFSTGLLLDVKDKRFLEHAFFTESSRKFYNDVLDHLMHMDALVVSQLESIKSMMEIYQNNLSNKTNQIMMTLTIFSAIFIPLSFIAGVFGMNFVNFPILNNPFGMIYFALISGSIVLLMILFIRNRNWFGK